MKLRIGNRKSALAVAQGEMVQRALMGPHPDISTEIITMLSRGDQRDPAAAGVEDKREWIAELEEAVVSGEIDVAIHSAKDVPVDIHPRTVLVPLLRRAVPFDAFIPSNSRLRFETLSAGATVGTCSLRRRAQLLRMRPDLNVVELRGNVTTRLEKLDNNDDVAAIVLAAAGLQRLTFDARATQLFTTDQIVPAVNQGILVAQCDRSRDDLGRILGSLVDRDTLVAWGAERSFISAIGADCRSCVGVYASIVSKSITLRARVLTESGLDCLEAELSGPLESPESLGEKLAQQLLRAGAGELLS